MRIEPRNHKIRKLEELHNKICNCSILALCKSLMRYERKRFWKCKAIMRRFEEKQVQFDCSSSNYVKIKQRSFKD